MALAISAGIIMLATYVLPLPGLRDSILGVVMIGAAAALVIGVINLLMVHTKKLQESESTSAKTGSAILILGLVVTFMLTMIQEYSAVYPAWMPGAEWLLTNIQIPVESALMGVLAITLVYAAARLVTLRPNIFSVVFVLTLLVMLVASTQIGLDSSFGQGIQTFMAHGLASGGARGILIGVALGTITTGLRILLGFDRPYGG
jgi:hypothetical protein